MDDHHSGGSGSDKPLLIGIVVIIVGYVIASLLGWTESEASKAPVAEAVHAEAPHGEAPDAEAADAEKHPAEEHVEHSGEEHGSAGHGGGHSTHALPHPAAVTPFVLLLGAIAIFPLMQATEHWWESNTNRFIVAVALASITLLYYLTLYGDSGLSAVWHRFDHAILVEYIPFITLLFSLYVISGGIRISGDLKAHSMTNMLFMAAGGLLASFVGTTGAAMLLIRPLLETNKERRYRQHTVVFFIFVVCNCGGCLLPIGDPPLFLGYLEGVNFMWTMWALWLPWLMTNALLLFVYFVMDKFYYYPKESKEDVLQDEFRTTPLRIEGLFPNALLLIGVIISVALLDPHKQLPGTTWYPFVYLREVVQLGLVLLSVMVGSKKVREENNFSYSAIIEVAALFVGIFICMQPALEILNAKGSSLGIDSPMKFYWITGALSSVLDNAPTYLVFFKTAFSDMNPAQIHAALEGDAGNYYRELMAISLGAVFMGAMTYIGNGPNFMVRAIAEESGVKMPSFFGYIIFFSVPILLPILAFVSAVFFLF